MLILLLSLFTFIYWALFGVYLFFDLYLKYPAFSILFNLLTYVIGLGNIFAIIYCAVRFKKYKKSLIIPSLILFTAPLIGIGCFFFWLFFLFKM